MRKKSIVSAFYFLVELCLSIGMIKAIAFPTLWSTQKYESKKQRRHAIYYYYSIS
jgi:hypothetical protein